MFESEKKEMLECALKLDRYGLIALSGGNVSVRAGDDLFIVTPSGMVLIIISSIFKQIARSRSFSPLVILAVIVQMVWSVVSSLLTFFNILLLVRLIAELLDRTQSRIWYSVDQVLNPIIYKIPAFFVRRRFIRPKTAKIGRAHV